MWTIAVAIVNKSINTLQWLAGHCYGWLQIGCAAVGKRTKLDDRESQSLLPRRWRNGALEAGCTRGRTSRRRIKSSRRRGGGAEEEEGNKITTKASLPPSLTPRRSFTQLKSALPLSVNRFVHIQHLRLGRREKLPTAPTRSPEMGDNLGEHVSSSHRVAFDALKKQQQTNIKSTVAF